MMTTHERPRLREDLLAEAIEEQGARFVDLIDPDTGSAFRLYDAEYSLACGMDGERDVAGLARWAQEELGLSTSPTELRAVISTLGELGYLSDVQTARDALATPVGMPAVEAAASGEPMGLGRFSAPAAAAVAPAAPAFELGAPGPGAKRPPTAPPVEVALGPAGGAEEPAAVDPSRVPTRPSVSRASRPTLEAPPPVALKRPSESPIVAEAPRRSEPRLAPAGEPARRPSDLAARASEPARRASEQALRANSLGPVPPVATDPSLNLSLPIRPDDVKEAVRASREMRSVDVPSDLMQALETAERPVEARRRPPSSVPPPSVVPVVPPLAAAVPSVATTPSATLAAVKPSPAVLDPISPLPGASVSVSEPLITPSVPPLALPRPAERPALVPVPKEPVAAPAVPTPQPSTRPTWPFVLLLLLAIAAVVAVIVWKFVLHKPQDAAPIEPKTQPTVTVPPVETTPPPPEAPPPITATLALVKAAAVTVKMPAPGALLSVVPDGTVVKEGDPVAVLAGGKAIEQKVAQIRGDLEKRYPEDLKRIEANLAKAAGNRELTAQYTAELARRKARIEQRTAELEEAKAALAKQSVLAAIAGKVTPMAKAGARLAADAEVASIEPAPYLRGTTDLRATVEQKVGDPIELRAKEGGAPITCIVKVVQDTKVELHCPTIEGFSDGTEIVYEPKK